jgi:uncharacterized protein DUF6602
MPKPFFERLQAYYLEVGKVLRGEAAAAAIFPNTTDIGTSRERVYAEFLRLHLPASCSVSLGGFLFNSDGQESKQLDILVVDDLAPQFNFHNRDSSEKTFASIDGCVAVASIKSTLDARELTDALDGFASLPEKLPLAKRQNPMVRIKGYDNWPYKIVYAKAGASGEKLISTLDAYFSGKPDIPTSRRPDLIHVGDSLCIVRIGPEGATTATGAAVAPNSFFQTILPGRIDAFALCTVVTESQMIASAARHLITQYKWLVEGVSF